MASDRADQRTTTPSRIHPLVVPVDELENTRHAHVAPIVDRTPTATRQLASRARRRVRGAATSRPASPERQRQVIDAFLAASRAGDFEALLKVLDPDVVVRADTATAGGITAVARELRGARAVAGQALRFARFAGGARKALINGAPGFVVFAGDRPFGVAALEVRASKIVEIAFILRPDRLARLDLSEVALR